MQHAAAPVSSSSSTNLMPHRPYTARVTSNRQQSLTRSTSATTNHRWNGGNGTDDIEYDIGGSTATFIPQQQQQRYQRPTPSPPVSRPAPAQFVFTLHKASSSGDGLEDNGVPLVSRRSQSQRQQRRRSGGYGKSNSRSISASRHRTVATDEAALTIDASGSEDSDHQSGSGGVSPNISPSRSAPAVTSRTSQRRMASHAPSSMLSSPTTPVASLDFLSASPNVSSVAHPSIPDPSNAANRNDATPAVDDNMAMAKMIVMSLLPLDIQEQLSIGRIPPPISSLQHLPIPAYERNVKRIDLDLQASDQHRSRMTLLRHGNGGDATSPGGTPLTSTSLEPPSITGIHRRMRFIDDNDQSTPSTAAMEPPNFLRGARAPSRLLDFYLTPAEARRLRSRFRTFDCQIDVRAIESIGHWGVRLSRASPQPFPPHIATYLAKISNVSIHEIQEDRDHPHVLVSNLQLAHAAEITERLIDIGVTSELAWTGSDHRPGSASSAPQPPSSPQGNGLELDYFSIHISRVTWFDARLVQAVYECLSHRDRQAYTTSNMPAASLELRPTRQPRSRSKPINSASGGQPTKAMSTRDLLLMANQRNVPPSAVPSVPDDDNRMSKDRSRSRGRSPTKSMASEEKESIDDSLAINGVAGGLVASVDGHGSHIGHQRRGQRIIIFTDRERENESRKLHALRAELNAERKQLQAERAMLDEEQKRKDHEIVRSIVRLEHK
jgi:hypothetical protein